MMKTQLQQFGLSKKEATIYVALLEIGSGTAGRIAQKAKLPKSTVADTLKTLSKKELTNSFVKKSRHHYSASDPILFKEKLERQNETLEQYLPQLQALFVSKSFQPRIRFYEGKIGMRIVMNEMLSQKKEILAVSNVDDAFTRFHQYFPRFAAERIKNRIPIRIIAKDTPKARDRQQTSEKELRQMKLVKNIKDFPALLYLWDHCVAMITLKEDFMIVLVESRDITQTFRQMFELLWEDH